MDGLPVPLVPSAGDPAHRARPAPAEDEDGPEVGAVLLPRFLHQVPSDKKYRTQIMNSKQLPSFMVSADNRSQS